MPTIAPLRATPAPPDALKNLPTAARRVVDPADVVVPAGYRVEPVLAGLSFPCGMGFADDGTLFVLEGGSTWPTRPYMPARVLRFDPADPARGLDVIDEEVEGGPRGVSYRDGAIYVSVKGGYHTHIDRYDLRTGERTIVVDGLPNGGWHEPGGPVFGPDGLMYFGQGSVSLAGVVLPEGFTVDIAKHPVARDVPGQDVTLTGDNIWSRDPRAPYPFYVETGAYKPYGVPAKQGEVVKGELRCNSGIWRARPDGSDMELLAWGVRNPYGLAFDEAGELFATDNDMEEKGERAVAEDPDRVWHIRNAKRPHGSVTTPDWYGFPELCADGLPVWHESHLPNRGEPAWPLLQDPPPWAGPAAYLFKPHTGLGKLDFCRSDTFGHRGHLFLCQYGTYAPLNTLRPEALTNGFQVARIDPATKEVEPFMRNREPGPASYHPGSGGVERPVDCTFSPDGRSLYVLDFGINKVTRGYVQAFAHTGVLWRVTRQ